MLECRGLSKSFFIENKEVEILKNISLKLPNNGFVLIYGNSGCGKTTLLNILEGIDKEYKGQVLYNNVDIFKLRSYIKECYIVFQEFNFVSNLSVKDSIKIVLSIKHKNNEFLNIENLLTKMGYKDILDKRINELSGGQKQILCVAIAKCIIPTIIFCDEVTGSVDYTNELLILKFLKELSNKCLIIAVSHNVELYKKYADHCYFLENGEILS